MTRLGLALFGLALSAAPVGAQQPAAGLDRPIADQTVKLPAAAGETPSVVHCVTYPQFVVRELHSDDDIGMESVALLPRTQGAACAAEPVAGERALEHLGMRLWGAVGIPADVAHRPAPQAACAPAYQKARLLARREQEDPSVVAFPLTVRITPDKPASLGPAGGISCWPAE
jgi:hypothetical protein